MQIDGLGGVYNQLERIANALERIARVFEGPQPNPAPVAADSPIGVTHSDD
jgi:hypothetical protein